MNWSLINIHCNLNKTCTLLHLVMNRPWKTKITKKKHFQSYCVFIQCSGFSYFQFSCFWRGITFLKSLCNFLITESKVDSDFLFQMFPCIKNFSGRRVGHSSLLFEWAEIQTSRTKGHISNLNILQRRSDYSRFWQCLSLFLVHLWHLYKTFMFLCWSSLEMLIPFIYK
jgi:hypothetical protein